MQKNKFAFCLFLLILFGLGASLWASKRDVPLSRDGSKGGYKSARVAESQWLQQRDKASSPIESKFAKAGLTPCQASIGTGAIHGRIIQSVGGAPIENVNVTASKLTCPYHSSSAYSDPDGYYLIDNLPTGPYKVYTSNDSVFLDLYWNNKPMGGGA